MGKVNLNPIFFDINKGESNVYFAPKVGRGNHTVESGKSFTTSKFDTKCCCGSVS